MNLCYLAADIFRALVGIVVVGFKIAWILTLILALPVWGVWMIIS